MKTYNICEFFVGAGGSHLGFMQNGFKSIYINDIDSDALQTLLFNNPEIAKTSMIDRRSITEIDPKILKKQINADIDVCFAGIVCKSFSLAGERSPNDKRNYFYKYYLNIIKELKPKISIIENVKGMLNASILPQNTNKKILNEVNELYKKLNEYKGKKAELRKKNAITNDFEEYGKKLKKHKQEISNKLEHITINVIQEILRIYKEIGYKTQIKVLNSAWYGSATKRERLIIVAVRNDIEQDFIYPLPTHYSDEINTKFDFDINTDFLHNATTIKTIFNNINYKDKNDTDNIAMQHSKKTIERFKYIKEGKNIIECLDTLPNELKISKFYSRGNTMRLKLDSLAPTLVPGHSNFPVHPYEHRSITVREAAAITGFPNNYKFFGSHTKRCEQVGNAVPIALSNAIAKATKTFLDSVISKRLPINNKIEFDNKQCKLF